LNRQGEGPRVRYKGMLASQVCRSGRSQPRELKDYNYLYCSIDPKVEARISYRKNQKYVVYRVLGVSRCQQGREL
jgi:hypothetical protein